ncbi:homoserine kinase, partial [Halomarina rubra]
GATGVTISGAGPTMLAVCRPTTQQDVALAMVDAFDDNGVEATAFQTRVGEGTTVYDD